MKKILLAGLATGLLMLSVARAASATYVDTVINISGTTALPDQSNAIVMILDPGAYNFTPVQSPFFAEATNPYTGALYNGAYSYYPDAWTSAYRVAINDRYKYETYGTEQYYPTVSEAFTHAATGSIILTETSNVLFGVGDSFYFDNDGGISLHLTGGMAPTPEPSTMLLMATGIAGLVGSRIRRKKK
jgi:hypothetical protein